MRLRGGLELSHKMLVTSRDKSYNVFDANREPPETGMAHFGPADAGGAKCAPGKVWFPRT